jgi:hypothetical protein
VERRQVLAACGLGLAGAAGCSADDATDQPDPDLPVRIVNDAEETQTVSLTVTRESGEVVHKATHEAPPGSDREVYNLRAADPDGVESFEIVAERGDTSDSVTVQTSECYGHVIVRVDEGGLGVTYSVC